MKAFFIIFKGLSMKQITQILLEGESPTLRMFALLVKQILKQFFSLFSLVRGVHLALKRKKLFQNLFNQITSRTMKQYKEIKVPIKRIHKGGENLKPLNYNKDKKN